MNFGLLKVLAQQATADGWKSTVMRPIQWALFLTFLTIVGLVSIKAPTWLLVFFCVLCSLFVVLYILAYVFFMFRNSESLRSEKYSISKLAIENGLIGDDITGFFEEREPVEVISRASTPTDALANRVTSLPSDDVPETSEGETS